MTLDATTTPSGHQAHTDGIAAPYRPTLSPARAESGSPQWWEDGPFQIRHCFEPQCRRPGTTMPCGNCGAQYCLAHANVRRDAAGGWGCRRCLGDGGDADA